MSDTNTEQETGDRIQCEFCQRQFQLKEDYAEHRLKHTDMRDGDETD